MDPEQGCSSIADRGIPSAEGPTLEGNEIALQ